MYVLVRSKVLLALLVAIIRGISRSHHPCPGLARAGASGQGGELHAPPLLGVLVREHFWRNLAWPASAVTIECQVDDWRDEQRDELRDQQPAHDRYSQRLP